MSTFHPFPRLPLKLQRQIWRCTVEPRTVEVRIERREPTRNRLLISPTPVPGPLQCCSVARDELQGLYQRVFFEIDTHRGIERRYVWLNLDIDMVDIGPSYFSDFKSIASNIKRLKFERENSDDHWYNTEKRRLIDFENVEEIHVVCADGFLQWDDATYDHTWPCAHDKILFFDPLDARGMRSSTAAGTNRVVKGSELERVCRQLLLDRRRALTGVAWHSSDESDS